MGAALIVIGLLLLLKNIFRFDFDVTLFVLGGLFLAAYFGIQKNGSRNIGYLIPGSILLFLGFNDLVMSMRLLPRSLENMAPLVFIGLAFLVIYLVSAALGPKTAHWALLVGAVLLVMAALTFIAENHWISREALALYGLPAALILIGLVILVKAVSGVGRKS
ncbi:hypothetical protein SAMN03080599_00138 [Acidaminobacter hydrogenoformans DSM 2784]|uniref:DUF5668 domain-containing protein n=2 Tax=Acidaminobacter TaxID=65402 RepID=A0A1G5RQV4_9FIRM|nr:hypothetical protein SAMN03080599_00138 [Acidaminobacter hydrogenoformans DSM 2784]